MTVTVAIPFKGEDDDLNRCVSSVLRQSHYDLRVLVIGDGQPVNLETNDSRVQTYELPENRGAYYARAVALSATETEWTAVIDSDDWVDDDWIKNMLKLKRDVVLQSSRWDHDGDKTRHRTWRRATMNPGPTLTNTTSHVGLYRTERLREIGGYNPSFRIGWDTLVVGLLRMTGRIALLPDAMYHRVIRAESLMHCQETGMGTPVRNEARAAVQGLYAQAWPHRKDIDQVRKVIEQSFPEALTEEVAQHAENIKAAS